MIIILFIVTFAIRMYFQSLSPTFTGSDAAIYSNAAQNFVNYGTFQVNIRGFEPHWIKIGAVLPTDITNPYYNVARFLPPSLIAMAFMLLGISFFAIKLGQKKGQVYRNDFFFRPEKPICCVEIKYDLLAYCKRFLHCVY